MKFSGSWLQEWIESPLSTDQLITQLTMLGLEVDGVEPVASDFSHVVVGQVIRCERHPNADKLHLCEVDVGDSSLLSIVCGASNVKAGMKVPVAKIGAALTSEITIKKTKLRGVDSHGMLCSAKELGLADTAEGLLELPEEAPLGISMTEYFALDDHMITIDLTPNRGDCASLLGIAREVAALNRSTLNIPSIESIVPIVEDMFPIEIEREAQKACPRYVGRIIKNINPQASTPIWMQERLRRSGLRTLNPVVDVTNYVLLEWGQPMHAFDLAKLKGGICVRFASSKEKLTLLNEDEIELQADTLVIADRDSPLAMAGVMGGLNSSVSSQTKDLFLESAFFDPIQLCGKARKYGLQTDSSYRFERGVDPALQIKVMERATQLLLEIVGGEPGPLCDHHFDEFLPQSLTIPLRPKRVNQLLGVTLSTEAMKAILKSLNLTIVSDSHEGYWDIQVPTYRFDVKQEADIIEEIARLNGYDNIPITFPRAVMQVSSTHNVHQQIKRIRELLQDRDYNEVVNYSFVDGAIQAQLDPDHTAVPLVNPIVSDMDVMRTNLWPGLLKTLSYNLHRQQNRIRLFETGLRFVPDSEGGMKQELALSGVVYGDICSEQWGEPRRLSDFFDVKSDIEAVLRLNFQPLTFQFGRVSHPALHSGQSAAVFVNSDLLGYLGLLHPQIAFSMNLPEQVILFEFDLQALQRTNTPSYREISKFPAVRRDLALLVDRNISVQSIQDVICKEINEFIVDLRVFDVYCGKGVEKNKKSVALGLTLQHPSRTLKDSEVNEIINRLITSLENTLKAKLRN